MQENNPHRFLLTVELINIQEAVDTWVEKVEIQELLDSAGGVSYNRSEARYKVVLADCHDGQTELIKVFVHEVFHIILFELFEVSGDHTSFEEDIARAAERIVARHKAALWRIITGFVSESELKQTWS